MYVGEKERERGLEGWLGWLVPSTWVAERNERVFGGMGWSRLNGDEGRERLSSFRREALASSATPVFVLIFAT